MVEAAQLQGRLVVWFDWGEYAIWHFAPALRVSIDGRRETVYTDQVMQKHLNFYYVPSSREAISRRDETRSHLAARRSARRVESPRRWMAAALSGPAIGVVKS